MKIIQITEEVKEKAIKNAIEISYSIYNRRRIKEESIIDKLIRSFQTIEKIKKLKDIDLMLETIEIMSNSDAFNSIQLALQQYKEGKLITYEELLKDLELDL